MKKIALAIAFTLSSTSLSAVESAGGIQWDTLDFGTVDGLSASFSFQQWFTSGVYGTESHNGFDVSTITASSSVALNPRETEVAPGIFASQVGLALDAGAMVNLSGVGRFDSLSDGRRQTETPSFCVNGVSNCELTFAFGGLEVVSEGVFDSSGAWLNIYYEDLSGTVVDATLPDGTTIPVTLPGTRPAEFGAVNSTAYTRYEEAQDGELWGSFAFDSFPFSGSLVAGTVPGANISIVGGKPDVVSALDTNDFLSDFVYSSSAQFGDTSNSSYSDAATGELTTKVSAPSTIGIFGMSLFGLAMFGRRKLK